MRPNVNWNIGVAPERKSTYTSKILKAGIPFSSQVTEPDTKYIIKYNFDLDSDVTLPENCILEFDGGSINLENHTIASDTLMDCLKPENFGAKGNGMADDRDAIQCAINLANTIELNGEYLVKNAPFDWANYNPIPEDELDYYKDVLAQKNNTPDSALTPICVGSKRNIIIRGRVKAYSPLTNVFEIHGDSNTIKGGGVIEGCGVVNSVNIYSGSPAYAVTGWNASNVFIEGSNNVIENITIKNPTRQGINVYGYASKHNIIQNCTIGGGLTNHTQATDDCSFTGLFGIYQRGQGTVVKNNTFKRLDGKAVYDSMYCNYTDAGAIPSVESREIPHTVYENNVVEEVLEHGIYSYAQRLVIRNNSFKVCRATALQLFNGYNVVENNIINVYTTEYRNNAIMVSGEHQTIRGNKIYNCTGYGIRCQGYYNGSCDYDIVENNYIEVDMAGSFSEADTGHLPTITFEASEFRDNKVVIDKVSCVNNYIVCKNPAHGRNTPIRGIIAVYGYTGATFKNIDILRNTVIGTCAQDLISISITNPSKESYVNIVGNNCLAGGVLTAATRYDPVIRVAGCYKAVISDNQVKHLTAYEELANAGMILELDNVYNIIKSNIMLGKALSNGNWINIQTGNKVEISYDNSVGGNMFEQVFTIASGSRNKIIPFQLGNNLPFYLNIIPMNSYAKDLEATDPCKMQSSTTLAATIGHTNNVAEDAIYKAQVIFYKA